VLKLVIFDLDGVLVDACEWHRVALNEALQEVCQYKISLEDHYNTFNGIPTKVKLDKLSELGVLSEAQYTAVYERKQTKTIEIINKEAPLRQEKIDLLIWLRDTGLPIACFTNSIRETAMLMLQKTGIIEYFDYILTNEDVSLAKPHPEGYLRVLEHFNVSNQNTLIVEDSPKGLEAACASGCKVLKVGNPDDVTVANLKEFIDENFNTHGR
jgi:HAD superfamily hydrolase (TIGR01509 family)